MDRINWWSTSFGEEEIAKLVESARNRKISEGTVTAEFEQKFAEMMNVPYAITVTSGTAALYLALFALGVGPGDEVIVPDRTWVATAHAAYMLGAKVVLVDVKSDVPMIDEDKIEAKITDKTKVILPVHLNGRGCNMEKIREIAKKYNIAVVEDAAQAMFSRNEHGYLGTQSDVGCFSLSIAKLISTGQGGVIVTRDKKLYDKLKLVKNHGVIDNFTEAWGQPGFNFKFTDLLASFGVIQLSRVQERIAHCNEIYKKYDTAIKKLKSIKMIELDIAKGEVPVWIDVMCEKGSQLLDFFKEKNVQARPFCPSLHRSSYFESRGDSFPNSLKFESQGIYLPCGPTQPLANIDRVIDLLGEYEELSMDMCIS